MDKSFENDYIYFFFGDDRRVEIASTTICIIYVLSNRILFYVFDLAAREATRTCLLFLSRMFFTVKL